MANNNNKKESKMKNENIKTYSINVNYEEVLVIHGLVSQRTFLRDPKSENCLVEIKSDSENYSDMLKDIELNLINSITQKLLNVVCEQPAFNSDFTIQMTKEEIGYINSMLQVLESKTAATLKNKFSDSGALIND